MKQNIFSEEDAQKIVTAIQAAESVTSVEFRVHVERHSFKDPMKRAVKIFQKLKMDQTKLRNGVLLYLAVKNRRFAIFADKGIHEGVPPDFWDNLVREVSAIFQKNALTDGICSGINFIGNALKQYFPVQPDEINELGDEVSIGN